MQPDELKARLERFWLREIPLTNAMQVSIDGWDGECITLGAALEANRNDKGTAFGGSLYSLAVLAGWGAIMLRLWQEHIDCDVVIQHAEVDYLAPVREALAARCRLDLINAWPAFVQQLGRRGKARLLLQSAIAGQQDDAMRLNATFVAISRA